MQLSKKMLPLELRLKIAQVELLYRQNLIGLAALTAYGASYLYFQWSYARSPFLIWWGIVLFTSAIARVLATYRWYRTRAAIKNYNQLRSHLYLMCGLLLVSGMCWGTIGWYIPSTETISVQMITVLVVILMASGGAVAYSATLFAPCAVFIPSLAPWAINSLMSPNPEHLFMGAMLLLYIVIGLFGIKNWYGYVQRSLKLNIENSLLAEQLVEQIRLQKEQSDLVREKNEIEAASRAKSVFLANVSHEIRTPLSAINGFADLLLENQNLDKSARQDLQMVIRNGKYLVSLVNDLLDLSKIETGQIYIEKSKISPLQEISDVVALLRPQAHSQGLRLNLNLATSIPQYIESDPTRFREVIINLLNNAVKYTQSGSLKVTVIYERRAVNEGTLRVRVKDTGIGIPVEAQKRLFRPFVRGESEVVQKSQGSGLGLALSQKLARLMGGELQLLSSVPNLGSEFEFSLQVHETYNSPFISSLDKLPNETDKETSQSSKRLLAGREILVVDDSIDLQLLMRRFLERHGAQVTVLNNGLEAVQHLKSHNYDVVLMDIKMPIMDGYTAAAELRRSSYKKPLVAVTAHANSDDRQLCYQTGFDSYISKPVTFSQLGEVLTKIVAGHRGLNYIKPQEQEL